MPTFIWLLQILLFFNHSIFFLLCSSIVLWCIRCIVFSVKNGGFWDSVTSTKPWKYQFWWWKNAWRWFCETSVYDRKIWSRTKIFITYSVRMFFFPILEIILSIAISNRIGQLWRSELNNFHNISIRCIKIHILQKDTYIAETIFLVKERRKKLQMIGSTQFATARAQNERSFNCRPKIRFVCGKFSNWPTNKKKF